MSIEKTIHYCWFGENELPNETIKYIKTWHKYCPDYEIIQWNEKNYTTNSEFVKKAMDEGKWAFVSDYARLDILFRFGGIYLDTDVELVKNLDDLLVNHIYMGAEDSYSIASGLGMGARKNSQQLKEIMEIYDSLDLENLSRYPTCVEITTDYLKKYGFSKLNKINVVNGITLYPTDYFCPQKLGSSKIRVTNNTYSIHHYSATWKDETGLLSKINYRLIPMKKKIRHLLGNKIYNKILEIIK